MNKKGVTLLTLGIMMALIAILVGAVVINAGDIIYDTELAKFGEELELIEDTIKEYYITYGNYPVVKEYTMTQIVALNLTESGSSLQKEIEYYKDQSSKFYLIDFNVVKISLKDRGLEKTTDDIYVISSDSNKVYYVRGVEIKDDVYFSTAYISNTIVVK